MPSPKALPEGGGARWRIDRSQKTLLEDAFKAKRFPSPDTKKRLADQLHVDVRRIQVWFQNRRQRLSAKEGAAEEQSSPPHELFDHAALDSGPSNLAPWNLPPAEVSAGLPKASARGDGSSPKKRSRPSGERADKGHGAAKHAQTQRVMPATDMAYSLSDFAFPHGAMATSNGAKMGPNGPVILADSHDIVHALMGFDQVKMPPPPPSSPPSRLLPPCVRRRHAPNVCVRPSHPPCLGRTGLRGAHTQPAAAPAAARPKPLASSCPPRAAPGDKRTPPCDYMSCHVAWSPR